MSYSPSSYDATRDGNRVPVAMGQSNIDSTQSLPFLMDHVTGRLLTDSSSSLTASWYNETPSGVIDGVNTVFTLLNTPAANSLVLTLARQPQILVADYTISGSTITYATAPDASLSGQPHNAIYATTGSISGVVHSETPVGTIDGANKAYTTTAAIGTVIGLWLNGEFLAPAEYTVSGSGFTMGTAIPASFSGDEFTIVYV